MAAAAAGLALAALTHAPAATGTSTRTAAATGPAATAIAYARAQLGKPYVWGGHRPGRLRLLRAGTRPPGRRRVSIPRTSEEQWAELPHVSPPAARRPGVLPRSDGTFTAPGHVALVIGGGQMIQAYAAGTPIEVSALNGDGAGGIVGYARPGGAS